MKTKDYSPITNGKLLVKNKINFYFLISKITTIFWIGMMLVNLNNHIYFLFIYFFYFFILFIFIFCFYLFYFNFNHYYLLFILLFY